ncbi:hypothetical protein EMCRGX_G014822 [Ephydatia muelleri]
MATKSKTSIGKTEYVNIISTEETVLETYFMMLSKFNFERAKEQCEREREGKASNGTWCDFMAKIWKLPRKDSLKALLDTIYHDMNRISEIYYHGRGGTDFSWERKMTDLVSSTLEYVSYKKEMTDFYVQLDAGESSHIDYRNAEKTLKDIHDRHKYSFKHPFLRPVRDVVTKEVEILVDMFGAQIYMAEWNFLQSLMLLQSAQVKLSAWTNPAPPSSQESATRSSSRPSWGARAQSPPPHGQTPALCMWLSKFHTALLAKFTLYFHGVLAEHATVYDMKYLSGKLDFDYLSNFSAVVKAQALCVCLVFDSTGLPDFKGPKYYLPDTPAPMLTGLNSYPFMITVPAEFALHHHRPNIVSIIMERSHQLHASTQLISQHDEKLLCTYYMTQVDSRMTLLAICPQKGKDTKVTNLLTDIASHLRNSHVIAMLRPG